MTDSTDMSGSELAEGEGPVDGVIVDADVPTGAMIFGWISEIFEQGIRRSGYPADIWAEQRGAEHFRNLEMENVRLEPVEVPRWEPTRFSLEAIPDDGSPVELDCFPVPYGTPVEDLEVELVAYDHTDPGRVEGKAALYNATLLELPAETFVGGGDAPKDPQEQARRVIDPDGTFADRHHRLPFPAEMQDVMEPAVDAGAAAFIGSAKNYPGDSFQYFLPYDGITRPIPGVWISGSDGDWLEERMAEGPVRVRLTIESSTETLSAHNVVGELPGADDEVVMIASHHDGPWASAVEDASGMALVLAQATYWAAQPQERRPHRLVFVLQAGHMYGGAGLQQYVEDHWDELDNVVLQVHLEHAALETDDDATPISLPVPRWFFCSRVPWFEDAVIEALETEKLHRSMLLAPNAIGERPPTDGQLYYSEGVPVLHFLAAPFYLFDIMDTLDKVDQENLVPLTRATIRIVESTAGVSAKAMRAADLHNPAS